MSISISELLKRESDIVTLPVNDRGTGENNDPFLVDKPNYISTKTDKGIIRPDNDRGISVSLDQIKESGIDPNDTHLTNPENYTEAIQQNLKIIGDTLSKYKQWKDDPVAYLSLFGGNIKADMGKFGAGLNKADRFLDQFGIDLLDSAESGVVPIPPYILNDDAEILSKAVTTVKKLASSLFNGKPSTNYELIRMMTTNSGVLNDIINIVTGDYLKQEFEKSRYPFVMPDSLKDEGFPTAFYEGMSKADSESPSIGDRIVGALKSKVNELIDRGYIGIDAAKIIYGNQQLNSKDSRIKDDYLTYNDPYQNKEINNDSSLSGILNFMNEHNLLTGYKDFAGFELGSDHLWKIELHPYQSKEHGSKTCVPPLPLYALPNLYSTTNEIVSGVPDYGDTSKMFNWSSWLNIAKDKIFNNVVQRVIASNDFSLNQPDKSIKSAITEVIWGGIGPGSKRSNKSGGSNLLRYFSFADDTPVTSYSLNLGMFKGESMPLFNGAAMEMIAGMTYAPTIQLTIIDDVYRSMFKYMTTYINAIYDIESSSLAPYYNMAFEIRLTILRTGGGINHKFRFIGIPIYYNPLLEGSEEPNRTQLDLTFSIVGFIEDGYDHDRLVFQKSDRTPSLKESNSNNEYQMTWDDIQIKMS